MLVYVYLLWSALELISFDSTETGLGKKVASRKEGKTIE